jgi:hypothetical protein
MPNVLAIVSRAKFELDAPTAAIGDRLGMDRYVSTNKHLDKLADDGGGRLFLVTVRPYEKLWLVAILERPTFYATEWVAQPSTTPITDITDIKQMLMFESGKGISTTASLGQSLQTPRALTADDARLLDAAVAGTKAAPIVEPLIPVARRDPDERTGYRIERAKSGRALCATCEQAIVRDDLRVAEPHFNQDINRSVDRFHHLDCAVGAHPNVVRLALIGTLDDVMPAAERDATEARIDASLERARRARIERHQQQVVAAAEAAPVETDDARMSSIYAQLDADVTDHGVLAVIADALQAAGDPRGELIAVQLALAANPETTQRRTLASDDDDDDDDDDDGAAAHAVDRGGLVRRRDELCAALAPPLDSSSFAGDRCIWGIGYIRRLELSITSFFRLVEVERIWRHPSLRFLTELRLALSPEVASHTAEKLAPVLPPTLRRVMLVPASHGEIQLGSLQPIADVLPRLDALALTARIDGGIAHASLRKLRVTTHHAIVRQLSAEALPAVSEIGLRAIGRSADDACADLVERHWLRQLTHLAITKSELTETGIARLASGLGTRTLARLDVRGQPLSMRLRDQLGRLCDELICDAPRSGDGQVQYAEHANKPEWGTGKVLRIFDGKIEIDFGKAGGKKVFKVDAPFLRLS